IEESDVTKLNRRSSETEFGIALKKLVPSLETGRKTMGGHLTRVYQIPPLDKCRKYFEEITGDRYEWPEEKVIEGPKRKKSNVWEVGQVGLGWQLQPIEKTVHSQPGQPCLPFLLSEGGEDPALPT